MAKAIDKFTIRFQGDASGANPSSALIEYTIADGDLNKSGQLLIESSPENVTWASAKAAINSAEGI